MRLSILTIGKLKKGSERELFDRYVERAKKSGGQIGLSAVDDLEWAESRAQAVRQRKQEEAELMLSALKPGSVLVALDENGKDHTSVQLAELLRESMETGVPQLAFAIGGPDGHGDALLNRANLVLRMGRMTWPHQLARVMLAEQLYRAITILTGHPYHRV